jgi:pectate lyase
MSRALLFCVAAFLLLEACAEEPASSNADDAPQGGTGSGAGVGGASAGAGGVTASGGTGGSSSGSTGDAGAGAAGAAGSAGGGGSSGSSGQGGSSGSAGEAGFSGSSGQGGASGSSGDGGSSGSSGQGGSGAQATLCEPMGWATRNGRTGGEVEVTGGGDATPVTVTSFDDLQAAAEGDDDRVIYIDGTVGDGWSGTSGDRLEVGSNKTIVGIEPGTELRAPIHIDDASNVIIRNLVIKGPGSNDDQAWDNLSIEGSSKNIWIDHCEFWDGQDGNADVVKGADNVTFTWNIFGYEMDSDHNFSNLVASSDDEPESENKLNITLMFNHFTGVAQRGPRCRYGNIHVVNNLYTTNGLTSDYGISAGKDCKIITENNHFIGINTPIYTEHASGSAANEVIGNIFEDTDGNEEGYGTSFEVPYDYEDLLVDAEDVEALVEASAGATLESPDDCE